MGDWQQEPLTLTLSPEGRGDRSASFVSGQFSQKPGPLSSLPPKGREDHSASFVSGQFSQKPAPLFSLSLPGRGPG